MVRLKGHGGGEQTNKTKFQFHMVRLKVVISADVIFVVDNFNSTWYD